METEKEYQDDDSYCGSCGRDLNLGYSDGSKPCPRCCDIKYSPGLEECDSCRFLDNCYEIYISGKVKE